MYIPARRLKHAPEQMTRHSTMHSVNGAVSFLAVVQSAFIMLNKLSVFHFFHDKHQIVLCILTLRRQQIVSLLC